MEVIRKHQVLVLFFTVSLFFLLSWLGKLLKHTWARIKYFIKHNNCQFFIVLGIYCHPISINLNFLLCHLKDLLFGLFKRRIEFLSLSDEILIQLPRPTLSCSQKGANRGAGLRALTDLTLQSKGNSPVTLSQASGLGGIFVSSFLPAHIIYSIHQ